MNVSHVEEESEVKGLQSPDEEDSKENSPMSLRTKRKRNTLLKSRQTKPKTLTIDISDDSHAGIVGQEFTSCLSGSDYDVISPTSPTCDNSKSSNTGSNHISSLTTVLKRAISVEELGERSWLSSSVIDLVFSKFAKSYRNVEYLSIDFIMLALNQRNNNNFEGVTDILGQTLHYDHSRPIVMLYNNNCIHWTLIRIQYLPEPTIQLFEPMGKPQHRNGQLSYRDVPRDVVRWLDTCCPLSDGKSWLAVTSSAITKQQQFTSFDCGVACLLYAEKCGLGHDKEDINELTSQEHITEYRKVLQEYVNKQKQNY
mmetsp:Transcript_17960/g.30050  ORF Transcript_17960/g.30050 Transcript_17960/m.30050 type:complete len:312 (-) Transcript_17960:203-1138(-)